MLVDLPSDWANNPANPYTPVFAEIGQPEVRKVGAGIYEGIDSHLFEHLVVREYPFDPLFDDTLTPEARVAAIRDQFTSDAPRDYGVCDDHAQILERWPSLLTDDRTFVITVREVRKVDQPADGGWRWHKNGEYIGTGDPQCEYLADEVGFDSVRVFHIVEVAV